MVYYPTYALIHGHAFTNFLIYNYDIGIYRLRLSIAIVTFGLE